MCWLNSNPVHFLIGRSVFATNVNKLKCVMNRVFNVTLLFGISQIFNAEKNLTKYHCTFVKKTLK